jgi:phage baseplate assembly protein W
MKLVETKILDSIKQNISIILTTPKGSDPHRPEFGSDINSFIDLPLTVITAGKIKSEITDAIERWEPRVTLNSCEVRKVGTEAKLVIDLDIYVKELGQSVNTSLWV